MKLATFNIAWLGHETRGPRTPDDIDRLADVIAHLDADALAFQEIVDPALLEEILEQAGAAAGRTYRVRDAQGKLLGFTGQSQKVISAYDAGRFEMLAGSVIWGGTSRLPYALRLGRDEGRVLMVNVHLQSGYPAFLDTEDAATRTRQCQHLVDWFGGAHAAENPGLPAPEPDEQIVLLGDFNALYGPDTPGMEVSYQSLDPLRSDAMAGWWWEKPLADPAGGNQTTSYCENLLIDFVMLSPSLKDRILALPTIYAFDYDPVHGSPGDCLVEISDHRPVTVEIDIDPAVAPD